ncbi:MAG: hypothetical protein GYA48_06450 [Chloroflexi bacterium]|nr:hypothetical protein [Chloroflexota bacterium]
MFEVLMQANGYRVDYFNPNTRTPNTFAFYVWGELKKGEPYSKQAKRDLFAGLALLATEVGWQNLAAVYLDVSGKRGAERKAFEQMKADARRGMFQRVFVVRLDALPEDLPGVDVRVLGLGCSSLLDGKRTIPVVA